MPRYFTKKITAQELEDRIIKASKKWAEENYPDDEICLRDAIYMLWEQPGQIEKDLGKVKFDWENYELEGPTTTLSNGLTYVGMWAAGD